MPRKTVKVLTMKAGGFEAMSHIPKNELSRYINYRKFEMSLPRKSRFQPFYRRR